MLAVGMMSHEPRPCRTQVGLRPEASSPPGVLSLPFPSADTGSGLRLDQGDPRGAEDHRTRLLRAYPGSSQRSLLSAVVLRAPATTSDAVPGRSLRASHFQESLCLGPGPAQRLERGCPTPPAEARGRALLPAGSRLKEALSLGPKLGWKAQGRGSGGCLRAWGQSPLPLHGLKGARHPLEGSAV